MIGLMLNCGVLVLIEFDLCMHLDCIAILVIV